MIKCKKETKGIINLKYIAIDIGSSFMKSALFDLELQSIIDQKKVPTPNKRKSASHHYFEIPAESIYLLFKNMIEAYTEKYNDIHGVVFSTQMHGFIYQSDMTEDTYISWQDSRCLTAMKSSKKTYIEYLQENFSKEEMRNTGVYIKPSLGMCNLFTLLEEISDEEKQGELYTLGSYLIAKLTGKNVCHITNAAPLGLVNVKDTKWHNEIIDKGGFSKITFPVIAKYDTEICGTYCSNGQQLKIYPDFGDQQTAILGSMAGENDVVLNIATAGQISRTTEAFLPGSYETRPFFDGKYLNTLSNMPSGRNLDVLISFLQDTIEGFTGILLNKEQIWQQINENFQFNNNPLLVNVGFYPTPENLDGGSIEKISPNNFNVQSLFSAAFANIADTYQRGLQHLGQDEKKIEQLVCAGGVSWKLPNLLKTISRVTGYPYRLSIFPDEVLSGLFRIALICEEICEGIEDKKELILKMEGMEK